MPGILLTINKILGIGFAHHFRGENYCEHYGKPYDSFEIVYIKSGKMIANLYGKNYEIPPGSILILPRQLPITLSTEENSIHTHCTVQILADAKIEFADAQQPLKLETNNILLPFITLPCAENEIIKKELYTIISSRCNAEEDTMCPATFSALGILAKLSHAYRQKLNAERDNHSLLTYKIKDYVSANMHKAFSLTDLANVLGKTPNYLNSVFKSSTGTSIRQYINREKIRTICELLENKQLSFKDVCESVSISDISYGYRLFKKHTGMTPADFKKGKTKKK